MNPNTFPTSTTLRLESIISSHRDEINYNDNYNYLEKYSQEIQIQRANVLQKKYDVIEDDLAIIDCENMFQTQKDISQRAKKTLQYKVKSKPKK